MGLKQGAIGNIIGEHIVNLKGTCWEQRKEEKIPPPPSPLKLKIKKKNKAL
jgi:hypothetical protein